MIGKNRYFRRSKISEAKFRYLLRLFAMDLTATDCAALCGLSVRSTNAIYQRLRMRMA
jgi:tRNA G26 N,N-dimethylase Trm1